MTKKDMFAFIRPAFLIGLTSSMLAACSQRQQAPAAGPQSVPVTVEAVTAEVVTGSVSYPANVVALKETELRAEVTGYITEMHVPDGAMVQAGQALVEIDKARFEAAVVHARANLAIAVAAFTRVQRDLERYEALAEKDAIARQTLDNTRSELESASAQREAMNAALTTATINLERAVIRAPFSGMVGISQVRNGALVTAGQTLINTISATTPIAVEFQAGENDLAHILALQQRPDLRQDSVLSLKLSDGSLYPLSGTIEAIDRAVNRHTGTILVRARFDNPDGRLRTGMSAILYIRQRSENEQVVIPYRAVMEQLGQSTVYVLADSNRVEQRVVKLGLKTGEKVVVQEGLQPGEQIVTEGMLNLRNGAVVRTQDRTQGAN